MTKLIHLIKWFYRHRITKNMFWVVSGTMAASLLGLLSNMYLARILRPAGFGKIAYAQTWAQYLVIIIDFGFSTYAVREIAKARERTMELVNTILPFRLGAALFLVSFFCLGTIFLIESSEMRILMLGSVLIVYGAALNLEWVFQGEERMQLVAISRVVTNFVPLFLYIILVKSAAHLLGVPFYRSAGTLATAFLFLFFLPERVSFRRFSWKAAVALVQKTQYFWYIFLFIQLYYGTDVVIMGLFRPDTEVGYYAAAFRLFALLNMALSLINVAIFPVLSDYGATDLPKFFKLIKTYLFFNILIGSLLSAVFLLFAEPVIKFLYGSEYTSSTAPFKILILGIVILMCNGPFSQSLLAKGYERQSLVIVVVCAIFNCAMNFVFIPRYGAIASATSFVISLLISTVWALALFNRKIKAKATYARA